ELKMQSQQDKTLSQRDETGHDQQRANGESPGQKPRQTGQSQQQRQRQRIDIRGVLELLFHVLSAGNPPGYFALKTPREGHTAYRPSNFDCRPRASRGGLLRSYSRCESSG